MTVVYAADFSSASVSGVMGPGVDEFSSSLRTGVAELSVLLFLLRYL